MNFTPASALHAAQEGQIKAWLHALLTTTGNNVPQSLGLKREPRWYLGPVRFPLALLARGRGIERISAAERQTETRGMDLDL